jgi:hypothetical protein
VGGDAEHIRTAQTERPADRAGIGSRLEALVDAAGYDRDPLRVRPGEGHELAAGELRHGDQRGRSADDGAEHEPQPGRVGARVPAVVAEHRRVVDHDRGPR